MHRLTPAFFFDRDGIINIDKNYLYKIKDFEFITPIFDIMSALQHTFKLIIVTNQSGIGRGYYTEKNYQILTKWMLTQFKKKDIHITHIYHCPHTPNDSCLCRKPKPGMLLNAQKDHHIDLSTSWIIGNNERDIEAGLQAGLTQSILVSSRLTSTKASIHLKTLNEFLKHNEKW